MANLNAVYLAGNMTRDPELRRTNSGTAVCEIGLAVNRKRKQGDDYVDETTFVDITVWGQAADFCGTYLRKGSPVLVEGRLQLDQWDDRQTGAKRSKLKVVADRVQSLASKQDVTNQPQQQQQRSNNPHPPFPTGPNVHNKELFDEPDNIPGLEAGSESIEDVPF